MGTQILVQNFSNASLRKAPLETTNSPRADSNSQIEDFLKELESHDEKWRECHKSEKIQVYRKKDKVTGIWKIKMIGILSAPPKLIKKALFEHDLRLSWDKVISNIILLESNENYSILHILTKSPVGIANRDFVHKRIEKEIAQGSVIFDVSVSHDKAPISPDYIRAHTFYSGGLFESVRIQDPKSKKELEGTKYSMLSQVDIKGHIPKMIVNVVSSRATVQWFFDLENASLNLQKQLEQQS